MNKYIHHLLHSRFHDVESFIILFYGYVFATKGDLYIHVVMNIGVT